MEAVKTYSFRAEIEPDEDGWFVRCPTMEPYGGFAGGNTKEEAWTLIKEILQANIETMLELGITVPEEPENPVLLKDNQAFIAVRPNLEASSKKGHAAKTYKFQVVVEPDEDQWAAYCPVLVERGAATCGYTREEAYINIHQVLRITLESMIAHGESIPDEMPVLSGEAIAITL